jgi:Trypsin-co-occurring domain 1
MSYLIEVPVDGGRLFVEADESRRPGNLELAARRPGEVVAEVSQSLERSLDQLQPAITAMSRRLRAMSPDTFTVEFGLVLGAECGLVVAKGSSEAHLTLTLSWSGRDPNPSHASEDG